MTKFFQGLVIVIALVILGMVGYTSYNYIKEKNSLRFTPIVVDTATTTPLANTVSVATSSVDTSKWKTYKNDELGYSISYPEDLIVNYDESKLILVFPAKNYFHWPLLDEVKLSLIATSSCITGNASTTELSINDRTYTVESDLVDVAMGSRWHESVYSIDREGTCYKITTSIRGTNGAGFYVDDQILIKKYDNQHDIDSSLVNSIIWAILGTFEKLKIPEGRIEG